MKLLCYFFFIYISILVSDAFANNSDDLTYLINTFKGQNQVATSENRTALEEKLFSEGYILSKVLLVDKELKVVTAEIEDITVHGLSKKNERAVKKYFSPLKNKVVNLQDLDRVLSLVNDLSGVSASFSIRRSPDYKKATIHISGRDFKQFGSISLDNIPEGEIERFRSMINQNIHSVISGGDRLTGRIIHVFGNSEPEQNNFIFGYRTPIGSTGSYLDFHFNDLKSRNNLYSPFGEIGQQKLEGKTYAIAGGYPIEREHDHTKNLSFSLERFERDQTILRDTSTNVGRMTFLYFNSNTFGDSQHFSYDFEPWKQLF